MAGANNRAGRGGSAAAKATTRAPLTLRTVNSMLVARQDARARREKVYADRQSRGRDRHVFPKETRRGVTAEARLKDVRHKLATKAKAGHAQRVSKAQKKWQARDRGFDPGAR